MGRFTIYTYRYLFMSAQRAYLRAYQEDASVECMSVILFSALALEAFLNHLGSKVFPRWHPLKRKLSPTEKLEVMLAHHDIELDWSKSPYQSFALAFQFRNLIVHAQTEHLVLAEVPLEGQPPPEAKWQTYCKLTIAKRVIEDSAFIFRTLPGQLHIPMDHDATVLAATSIDEGG